jgi:ribulose-phosphate 3-epimerase
LKRSLRQLPCPAIGPSILAADFAHLADEIARVEQGGANFLHVDVMDGHFVPNITVGPAIVRNIRAVTDLPLDVHLMIQEPARYIHAFAEAGADSLTFHAEVVSDPAALAARIHELGCSVGVTVNPDQPIERLREALPHVDVVLMMTVFAGFGGQKFIPEVVPKIRTVKGWLGEGQRLEADGGLNQDTVSLVAEAGADTLVAGTAVFGAPGREYAAAIATLRRIAAEFCT